MTSLFKFNTLFELTDYFSTEKRCRQAIKESRWPDGDVVCPYCGGHHCAERKDARKFKRALKKAKRILRYSECIHIKIRRQR